MRCKSNHRQILGDARCAEHDRRHKTVITKNNKNNKKICRKLVTSCASNNAPWLSSPARYSSHTATIYPTSLPTLMQQLTTIHSVTIKYFTLHYKLWMEVTVEGYNLCGEPCWVSLLLGHQPDFTTEPPEEKKEKKEDKGVTSTNIKQVQTSAWDISIVQKYFQSLQSLSTEGTSGLSLSKGLVLLLYKYSHFIT